MVRKYMGTILKVTTLEIECTNERRSDYVIQKLLRWKQFAGTKQWGD